ncbi:MAG: nucleoside-diphosphate kinase, partial [Muribaculaceae bacterium]|nr:nucleoside-diphosphate kinase [Muribaculaceae bacterium]
CMVLKGVDAVETFRKMTGSTNGRKAAPGTLRGDFCMSGQENIIHASDSVENAQIEINRFFRPEEIFDYTPSNLNFFYGADELK